MAKRTTFTPTKKQKPIAPVAGGGTFAITGKAATRLEPRTISTTLGSPTPLPSQIEDSQSIVTPQRLYYHKLTHWEPLLNLKPELLRQYLNLWEMGYLRYFALMADAMAKRDAVLTTVIPKRKAALKRLRWDVFVREDLDAGQLAEAEQHKQALFYFYNNLRCSSAVDLNIEADIRMLFDQMLEARKLKYAVHELIFKPSDEGLTARFNFIPVWFFENRSGKLRFLEMDYQLEGRDLVEGSFMKTVSPEMLMECCSLAYLFKGMSIKWWVVYMEGHASPIKVGKTDSPPGSVNYTAFSNALQQIIDSILINSKDELEKLDISAQGQLPYGPLVTQMDQYMTIVWRGSDLSTQSGKTSGGGQGAMLQGAEEYNIKADDAALLSEVFNIQIDPLVIGWTFGEGTKPLAYMKIVVPPNVEAATDVGVITALNGWGVELGKGQVRDHFGYAEPKEDDEPIEKPPVPAPGLGGKPGGGPGGAGGRSGQQEAEEAAVED